MASDLIWGAAYGTEREEWSSAGSREILREGKWPCGAACFEQSAGPRDGAGELMARGSAPDLGPGELRGLSSTPTPMMRNEHIPSMLT